MVSHFFVKVNEQKVKSVDICINEQHSKEKLPYVAKIKERRFYALLSLLFPFLRNVINNLQKLNSGVSIITPCFFKTCQIHKQSVSDS